MSFLEDVSESITETPLIWVAVGLAALASPKIISAGRPLIKGAIKGAIAVETKAREVFAESKERVQDVYEEAKYEMKEMEETVKGEKPAHAAAAKPMKKAEVEGS